jgi:small subunit ribosomal protein S2
MVDTNSDPRDVDFVIPSNDDASKSIDKILSLVTGAVAEGLGERKKEKEGTSDSDAKDMEAAVKQEEKEAVVAEPVAEAPVEAPKEEPTAPETAADSEEKEA